MINLKEVHQDVAYTKDLESKREEKVKLHRSFVLVEFVIVILTHEVKKLGKEKNKC